MTIPRDETNMIAAGVRKLDQTLVTISGNVPLDLPDSFLVFLAPSLSPPFPDEDFLFLDWYLEPRLLSFLGVQDRDRERERDRLLPVLDLELFLKFLLGAVALRRTVSFFVEAPSKSLIFLSPKNKRYTRKL